MVRKVFIAMLLFVVTSTSVTCVSFVKFEGMSEFDKPIILSGTLGKPKGEGPFPAVVLLHGCAGPHDHHSVWASRLRRWGYVTLIVNSLSPRGVKNICGKGEGRIVSPLTRAQDAYNAKSYLARLPFVDPNRIAVIGWSHGARSTIEVVTRTLRREKPFRAAVAFYPYCDYYLNYVNAPLIILIGELDDWTPSVNCSQAVPSEGETIHEIILKVYPGAYHSFDNPVHFGGRWYRGHLLSYNKKATADSIFQVKKFLAKHLQ